MTNELKERVNTTGPTTANRCELCRYIAGGAPSLTLLLIGLSAFSIYRFWILGWAAIGGNLRLAAFVAICLGLTGVVTGPLTTFGVCSRRQAAVLLGVAVIAFIILNFL